MWGFPPGPQSLQTRRRCRWCPPSVWGSWTRWSLLQPAVRFPSHLTKIAATPKKKHHTILHRNGRAFAVDSYCYSSFCTQILWKMTREDVISSFCIQENQGMGSWGIWSQRHHIHSFPDSPNPAMPKSDQYLLCKLKHGQVSGLQPVPRHYSPHPPWSSVGKELSWAKLLFSEDLCALSSYCIQERRMLTAEWHPGYLIVSYPWKPLPRQLQTIYTSVSNLQILDGLDGVGVCERCCRNEPGWDVVGV